MARKAPELTSQTDRLASQSSNAGAMLTSYVSRIERLTEEKAALQGDITEVFADAKGAGFDTKIIREILRERKMDAAVRQERDALLTIYRKALGMLDGTPLGEAALGRVAA